MKKENNPLILCLFGILPVVWLGLLIAPAAHGGLPEIVARFPAVMNDPFHIELCGDSLKTVIVLLCAYGLTVGVILSSRRNYRRGEEHGSAKWGSARTVNRKYRAAAPEDNKIFTQNVRMGLDGRKHRRNLNTVVVGGSGAGKTRFYAKPNLCQANTSFTVLDPKGELLRSTGHLLRLKGYEVRVLDLLNMEKSHCYNPFVYLRDDNDVQRLVTNLFKSTTPKGSQSNDPFWDTAASMLLLALIFYLKYEAPPDEQNFPMVMEMLRAADVREDCDECTSPLDELFERLEMRDPDHIAVKYYKDYHSGSAKTLKSIQITLAARLEKFNLSSLAALTATDELDLPSLGEKKVALFALIPDNDTSFNFLVSILYTQLFQQLFYLADHKYGGSLPVPVHFLMDEFSNVSLPEDFSKILAVMRSRNVYVSIILQNVAALKALFEKEWESILGNCDEFLYLGGNETSTHKLISESYLGKSTTLTTESLAVFMPFKVQEVQDKGGIYFGENAISHNLIMCNKANLLNQSAFLLGVPGSGKSFSAKELIAFLILNTTDDVLVCDPENEFGALAAALGKETATVIHMAAGGKDRLNAMYMVDGYGENNPIVEKSQFIMSLVEQIDKAGVGPQQKSIIDRCTALVYQDAERTGKPATLCDLRNKLLEQPEEKAKEIALSLELFTTGSLDIFGHESTVDLDKRIVVFDIHGLGEQLKPTGLLVITDTILNRVTLNWKKGKRTHIFIDEFHVVFENEQSGIFFNSAWRQFRKRNGYPTAITQNVEYLLDSVQASTMLSNSEFVVMLNQAFSDRAKLSKLLNISDEQMSYVTNADAGCGLIKYGSALVPFINRFPKDTELYRLMTTRPGEGVFGSGNAS